jgi:hypothetical protein
MLLVRGPSVAPRIVRGRPSRLKGASGVADAIATRPLTREPLRPLRAAARAGQGPARWGARRHRRRSRRHDQGLGAETGDSARERAEAPIMRWDDGRDRRDGTPGSPLRPLRPSCAARGDLWRSVPTNGAFVGTYPTNAPFVGFALEPCAGCAARAHSARSPHRATMPHQNIKFSPTSTSYLRTKVSLPSSPMLNTDNPAGTDRT